MVREGQTEEEQDLSLIRDGPSVLSSLDTLVSASSQSSGSFVYIC